MHRWLLWTPDLSQWSTQGHGDNWDTHPNTQLTTGNWWRNISSQLQRIGCHWGLLWRQEGSYWSTAWSRMPLVTTVIPIWIGSWLLKTNEGSTVVNWRKINVTGDYCILIQIYSWLLWSQGGFRVVYCRDLNIIGDYCDTSQNAQVTTVDSRSVTVVNCMFMVTTGTLIKIHNWLLWTGKGTSVVHHIELDVIGDYCRDKRDHSG